MKVRLKIYQVICKLNFHSLAKTSHDAPRATYRFIPMQDFSNEGDIDWSVSTENIDRQLYEKYGLSNEEIDFIESKIKAM